MAQSGSPIIYWVRRDFRLGDNPALAHAAATGASVVPVYVYDHDLEGRPIGAAAKWWLWRTLLKFGESLARIGSQLVLRSGDAGAELGLLIAQTGARTVVFNRLPEPDANLRDDRIAQALRAAGVEVIAFDADTLVPLGQIKSAAGFPYKVFTPFFRALRAQLRSPVLPPRPHRLMPPAVWPKSERIEDWRLYPRAASWAAGFEGWRPGEEGAEDALQGFRESSLAAYAVSRDAPGVAGTTRLSPHLHWGEISPRRVLAAAEAASAERPTCSAGAEKLISELAWREFNRHLLAAFPSLPTRSFDRRFERFAWRQDPAGLEAWRTGRTGYPLVDAGMRELWATGFMHNRVRMVAASFLIKHLLIDWRQGEAWFWDTLLDADLANNAANWQWVAGSGADSSPSFRIFNPTAQGERFDADGAYVRRWVPELARIADHYIHAPWKAPEAVLQAAGVRLGSSYPRPIVDHDRARRAALDALGAMQGKLDSVPSEDSQMTHRSQPHEAWS